jgi:hypothetical protein
LIQRGDILKGNEGSSLEDALIGVLLVEFGCQSWLSSADLVEHLFANPSGGLKGRIRRCRRAAGQPNSAASMVAPLAKGATPQ